jgi:hypothetical protein
MKQDHDLGGEKQDMIDVFFVVGNKPSIVIPKAFLKIPFARSFYQMKNSL